MPATDTTDFEREFEELVRDLRALPTAAPESVRVQIRALGEPGQRLSVSDRVRSIPVRRSVLVLAPACVLGLVVAAVVHGVLSSGTPQATGTIASRGQAPEGVNPRGAAGGAKAPPVHGTGRNLPRPTFRYSTSASPFSRMVLVSGSTV